jgi:hypothetical protein
MLAGGGVEMRPAVEVAGGVFQAFDGDGDGDGEGVVAGAERLAAALQVAEADPVGPQVLECAGKMVGRLKRLGLKTPSEST